jgi:5,10-methylene-tetrahydrofolate dehydrogenase/methenyl tetrahydrofolate cyclohydrolase
MTRVIDTDKLKPHIENAIEDIIKIVKTQSITKRDPKLAIIVATDDKSTNDHINYIIKKAKEFNIEIKKVKFDSNVETLDIENTIEALNNDNEVDGIYIQTPMYSHLDQNYLLNIIEVEKDVEGVSNFSRMFFEEDQFKFMPAIPLGTVFLLDSYGIKEKHLRGKNVVIIGRGIKTGSALFTMFKNLNANVTMLHSHTKEKDLEFYVKNADVIVSCVGKRYLLRADWVKEDAVIIGVGYSHDESNNKHLDIEIDKVIEFGKASFITKIEAVKEASVYAMFFNLVLAFSQTV